MNKSEAIKRLDNLEHEAQELRKIINKKASWQDVVDFESACLFNGDDANSIWTKWRKADLTDMQICGLQLEYCIKTINQDWAPRFKDSNQKKWYNWYEMSSSGGWVLGAVIGHCSGSRCGAGFYYETEEKARHGDKYFKQYSDVWLGNK